MDNQLISVIVYGGDNMSDYNKCNIDVLIPKQDLIKILEEKGENILRFDGYLVPGSPGEAIEILSKFSKKESVLVERHGGMYDEDAEIQFEYITVETINFKEHSSELNTNYFKKGIRNSSGKIEWTKMNPEEIKDEYIDCVDNWGHKYYGFDIYSYENFDLALEMQTGY